MELNFEICSILDDFNAGETEIVSTARSFVVNVRLAFRPFRVVRNIVTASVLDTLASIINVSSVQMRVETSSSVQQEFRRGIIKPVS